MLRFAILSLGFCFAASLAHADPCRAIPERGPLPAAVAPGRTFSGPVVYVADGDSLCVAIGSGQQNWVEVRIADFYAPELYAQGGQAAKATMARIAMGRVVACRADHRSYDRIVAVCSLGGVSLGERMRRAGMTEGGRGRR